MVIIFIIFLKKFLSCVLDQSLWLLEIISPALGLNIEPRKLALLCQKVLLNTNLSTACGLLNLNVIGAVRFT
jgi:hypothetical protein